VVADDRRAVGAQAMFGNCCTSYDIPLQLVIYSRGKTHRFEGGLAIFDWHFADGGKRVAFSQQTVHFTCSVHWELRDTATERLVAEGSEHAVYVWTGSGTAATGEGSHAAVEGWAFTIVKGDAVTFEAGPDGLRLFVVTLDA